MNRSDRSFVSRLFAAAPVAVLALGFALPARAQNIVTNGGFETGNLTGWTQSGGGDALLVNGSLTHSGSYAASFQSDNGQPNTITQTIATTPGLMYTFSFYLRNEVAGNDSFNALFNNNNVLSLKNTTAEFGYTLYSYNILATTSASTITFSGYDTPARFRLDDISVVVANNLVTNGGFETGNLSGWTQSGGGDALLVNSSLTHSGSYAASFQSDNGLPNTITQTVNTTPGEMYNFSFYLRNEVAGNDNFSAFFNDNAVLSLVNTTAEFGYTQYSYNVMATSSTSTLTFSGYDIPARFRLDDITFARVFSTAAPEPGSLALLALGGISGLGMIARKRRS